MPTGLALLLGSDLLGPVVSLSKGLLGGPHSPAICISVQTSREGPTLLS